LAKTQNRLPALILKQMVTDGDVLAVRVIGQKSALIYLADSSLKKSKYSEEAKGKIWWCKSRATF
jgi:hypothetical protein